MSEFLKNLRNSQNFNQKQYDAQHKGKPRNEPRGKGGGARETSDIPDYLKALFDDLAPVVKKYLAQAAESQIRLAEAAEKNAQALQKVVDAMPELIQAAPFRREPRKRKISAHKQQLLDMIKKLRDENMTYEEVAAYLDKNKVPTFSGRGRWHAQTIHRLYMYYP
ncbi:MAG: hypothetical protein AB1724_16030 [Thermodesulfobacteriota bacterium]